LSKLVLAESIDRDQARPAFPLSDEDPHQDALLRKVLVKADMDLDRTETDWIAEMQIECQTFHLTIVEETTGCFVKLSVHCICARARAP
jgi:hypothetical protein